MSRNDTTAAIYAILGRPNVRYQKILDYLLAAPDPVIAYYDLSDDLDALAILDAIKERFAKRRERPIPAATQPNLAKLYFHLSRATIPLRY